MGKVCVVRTVLSRHHRCAQRHSWTQTPGTDDVPDINTLSEVPTRLALHGDTLDSGRLTSERAGWVAALRARITSKVPQPGVASCCSPKRLISAPRGVSFSVSPVVGELGVERNDGATEYLSSRNTMPRWLVSLRDGQPSVGWVFSQSGEGQKFLAKPSKQRGCARGWDDPQDGSQGTPKNEAWHQVRHVQDSQWIIGHLYRRMGRLPRGFKESLQLRLRRGGTASVCSKMMSPGCLGGTLQPS